MREIIDITGQKFGRLTVLECKGSNKYHAAIFLCKCDCGNEIITMGKNLRNGFTKSCGCWASETKKRTDNKFTKHGMCKTRLYRIWSGIKQRCYNPNAKKYHIYSNKTFAVCDEWLGEKGFENFYNWAMANGYADNLTIDRIDNNGGYSTDNCRWITNFEQQSNKSNNHYITYNNETLTLSQWAKRIGIDARTLHERLRKGWTEEKTLTTPLKKYNIKQRSI